MIMLLAIIVLYQLPEGSRHILVFLMGFIIVGAMRDNYAIKKNLLIMAVFTYLFAVKYEDASGYHVPYLKEDIIQETQDLSNAFYLCISLNYENVPSYDNVVGWVIADSVDGKMNDIPWRILFALPEGSGISCCLPQYITENIDELKGRYLIAIPNGRTDLLCQEKEMELLMREESFVLYKTY